MWEVIELVKKLEHMILHSISNICFLYVFDWFEADKILLNLGSQEWQVLCWVERLEPELASQVGQILQTGLLAALDKYWS